ncbi:MAG: dnaJ 4 [Planctomycetota bacterium]|nr:dnaJ 4 [Planctomycetota bacterium]
MAQRDYYEILGVPRDATADQVKKAYRNLARQHHPDVNPGDKTSEAKFKEAQSAYDILSDPEKRKRYDAYGHAGFEGMGAAGPRSGGSEWSARQAPPGYENVDFSQFFGGGTEEGEAGGGLFDEIFGRFGGARGGRRAGPQRGADLEASITIPFATAVLGGPTTIDLAREDGSRESLEIKIPPGTESGKKLRLKGRGGKGEKGAPNGDLTITVTTQPDPRFERDHSNLRINLPITIDEAVLGARIEVPTLAGTTVTLSVPAGSSCGQKLRVRGKGVPAHGNQPDGDLFVVLKIVVPKNVDEESRQLIQEFARRNPMHPREGL